MLYTLEEHEAKSLVPKEFEESRGMTAKINKESINVLQESAKGKNKRKLIVKMEAIHVGRTRNSTFYTEEGLKGGLKSWTQPYNKPVLTHHNSYDGEPIGRILNAEYSEQTLAGKGGLIFTVEVTDPDAIEKVLDGRYQTVSIGATTDKVTCNICGTDRTEEWCAHYPGKKYDEQSCHFIIGNTYGREVSYVNTPSDVDAGNRSVEVVNESGKEETEESATMEIFQMAEGLYQDASNPEVNLYEHLNDDVRAMVDLMTKVQEGSNKDMDKDKLKDKDPEQKESNQTGVEPEQKEGEGQEGKDEIKENVDKNQITDITEAQTVINDLTEKVSRLQESVSNLVLEKQKMDSALTTAEAEVNTLTQENARLLEERHSALAEQVVNLKRDLRRADVIGATHEEAVQEHVKRTSESLEDTLKDLIAESKRDKRPEPGSVENPGLSEQDNKDQKKDSMTFNEAESLLKNMFSRKK